MPFPEAVEKAIDECIKKGILAEFLRKNRAEVLRVSIFEYDEEEHMRQEREESRQEGIEQVNDLYDKLFELGRSEDVKRAVKDAKYRSAFADDGVSADKGTLTDLSAFSNDAWAVNGSGRCDHGIFCDPDIFTAFFVFCRIECFAEFQE